MDSGQSTRMRLVKEVTVLWLKGGKEKWVCLQIAVEQACCVGHVCCYEPAGHRNRLEYTHQVQWLANQIYLINELVL